ncbi:MAG: YceI family protein [Pseudomonadota bacterium]
MKPIKSSLAAICVAACFTLPAVAAETFTFDPGHSQVVFSWNHLGLSEQSGKFVGFGGQVTLDEAAIENSTVRVEIVADSLQTGNPEFDGHLRSDEFFDVAVHPNISFVSNSVKRTGPNSAEIMGDLTIRGITRPVTLDAQLNFLGEHPTKGHRAAGFKATTRVLRSDFGLGAYAPLVSDEIDIIIATELAATS